MSDHERVDLELDRLLSGGGLSGPEEDAILSHVLDVVAPEPAAQVATAGGESPGLLQRLGWWLAGPPVLAAAVVAIFVALPSGDESVEHGVPATDADGFKSRGEPAAGQPAARDAFDVEVSCGKSAPCTIGEALLLARVFDEAGFLSAALVDETGAWMWLFESEAVSPGARFDYRVDLPDDLSPGAYRLRALFSAARDETAAEAVKAAFTAGPPTDRSVDVAVQIAGPR